MNTHAVDEAIHKYVNERMEKGKRRAEERFLSYAYMKFAGDELCEFMKRVGGIAKYYMDFFKVMENPFKGPELAWLFSLIVIGVFGGIMTGSEETRNLGIFTLTGTLINAATLIAAILKKWCNVGVLIAIYRELAEIAENEMRA